MMCSSSSFGLAHLLSVREGHKREREGWIKKCKDSNPTAVVVLNHICCGACRSSSLTRDREYLIRLLEESGLEGINGAQGKVKIKVFITIPFC